MTRTEEIVAELNPQPRNDILAPEVQAWCDFVKKYHFAVVEQFDPQGDIIPNALYVDPDTMDFDYTQEGAKQGILDGSETFDNDWDAMRKKMAEIGFKTIDDMPSLEQGFYVDTPENRKVCAQALAEHPEYRVENLGALPDKDQAVQNTASSDIATHIQQAVSRGDICEMCKDNFKLAVRNYQAALMAKGLDRTDTNKTMLVVMNEVNAETKSKNFVQ